MLQLPRERDPSPVGQSGDHVEECPYVAAAESGEDALDGVDGVSVQAGPW